MSAMTWLMVALRVVANPFSNALQKLLAGRGADPLGVVCVTHGLLSVVCLPACAWFAGSVTGRFWVDISICAALAVAGNALIVQAVKLSDLSVLGPINAYKSVVSLVPAIVLLGEMPSAAGSGGILLIIAGSYLLVDRGAGGGLRLGRLFADSGVQYRLGGLVLSAVEAVFLKRALLASSPLITFAFWAVAGFGLSAAAVAALGRTDQSRASRGDTGQYLLLGLTTGVMQLCTLLTFEALQVGYALALFQTSAILSVVLGYGMFRERHFARRLAGSLVMAGGAALIVAGAG